MSLLVNNSVGFDRQKNNSSVRLLSLYFNDRSFSLQNLLQQQLLIATRKYLEFNNSPTDRNCSLLLDNLTRVPLYVNRNIDQFCYRSAIGFSLASRVRLSPAIIAKQLAENILALGNNRGFIEPETLKLAVDSNHSGWLDFYLDDRTIAIWLDRLSNMDLPYFYSTAVISKNTFPLQYAHARCRSLLDLATRQGMFDRVNNKFSSKSEDIYLSRDDQLIFAEDTELGLILNLLQIVDLLLAGDSSQKLLNVALCLSESFLNFHASSSIFNPRHRGRSQLIQARFRLVEKVNFVLKRILECLKIEPLAYD